MDEDDQDDQNEQESKIGRSILAFLQSLAIVLVFVDALLIWLDHISKRH